MKKTKTCVLVSLSHLKAWWFWSWAWLKCADLQASTFWVTSCSSFGSIKVPVLRNPQVSRLITDRMITRFTAWLPAEFFSWLRIQSNVTEPVKAWSEYTMWIYYVNTGSKSHKISHIFWAGAFQWQLALCRRSICTRSVARRRSIIGTPNVWQTKREFKRMN